MLPDRSLLDAIASAVTFPLIGDRRSARVAADSAVEWLEQHEDVARDLPAGWLAAAAVERGLAAPVVPGRSHDVVRRRLAQLLSDQPIAGRVVLALVGLCGYDRATAAELTRRSVEDVDLLLAPFAALLDDLVDLRDPGDVPAIDPPPPPPTPPPPPPWELPAEAPAPQPTGIWTTPPSGPPIEELAPRPAPGRRLPISAGTTASVLAVIALVVLITVPHGERPSFAEGSRLPRTPASDSTCNGSTDGAARRLEVGAEANPARFFLPPGTNAQVPLVVLIGDAGQPADDIASASGLEGVAATQGFALVTLDGTSKEWNVAGVADRADDVALVQAAIDAAQSTGCVDGSRTVLVGYGRGGHLAAVVTCRDTSRVAGLAMIRGPYLPAGCAPTRQIPVLMESDSTDAVIPFDGGWGATSPSDATYTPTGADAARDGWADLDGCDPTSVTTDEATGVAVTERQACAAGSSVTSRVSDGYGHEWPTDVTPALAALIDRAG